MATLASSERRRKKGPRICPGRESSEDETQRLSGTLIEAATLYRLSVSPRATISGTGSDRNVEMSQQRTMVGGVIWNSVDLGMLLERVATRKRNVGFPQGGTSAVGAMTLGGALIQRKNQGFRCCRREGMLEENRR